MATERHSIEVRGTPVEIVRKNIKHLHLAVYPPAGRVRVSAPLRLTDEAVRLAVISRFGWVRRKQADFAAQERQTAREMVSGESHYVAGRRYRLDVREHDGPASVKLRSNHTLQLIVRRGSDAPKREAVLDRWYREQLGADIELFVAKWEPVIQVRVTEWAVRRMRTRWGTCNPARRRIWLNAELAKKPSACVEYVVVHEMVHLLVRKHDERFKAHMDRLMPQWRLRRNELNHSPLVHQEWDY